MDLRSNPKKVSSPEGLGCPICFSIFKNQLIGRLDTCEHKFCLDCILTWSKDHNECPVDRVCFQNMSVIHKGTSFAKVVIQSLPKKRTRPERYDFTTFCEICMSQNQDQLILCKACNLAFHMYCLKPPLRFKPRDQWYCPDCAIILFRKSKKARKLTKHEALPSRTKLRGSKSSDECVSVEDELSTTDRDFRTNNHLTLTTDNNLKTESDDNFKADIIYLEAETNDDLEAQTNDDLESEVNDDLESEVNDDLESEVNDDLESEVNDDLESEVNDDLESEVNDDLESEVNDDLESEVNDELEAEVNGDLEAEVNGDLEAEVNDDLEAEVNDDLEAEVNDDEAEVNDNFEAETNNNHNAKTNDNLYTSSSNAFSTARSISLRELKKRLVIKPDGTLCICLEP